MANNCEKKCDAADTLDTLLGTTAGLRSQLGAQPVAKWGGDLAMSGPSHGCLRHEKWWQFSFLGEHWLSANEPSRFSREF